MSANPRKKYRQNYFFIVLLNIMRISETGKPLPLRKTASPSPANVRKNPAYLHRPCQNPEALSPAIHCFIDMRAELYAFARQGVRITSGVDSRIEIGMDFIRRHVQQGDYPISRSFPHESQQAILGIVADLDRRSRPAPRKREPEHRAAKRSAAGRTPSFGSARKQARPRSKKAKEWS